MHDTTLKINIHFLKQISFTFHIGGKLVSNVFSFLGDFIDAISLQGVLGFGHFVLE
jgi:hypothetical protein